MSKTMSITLSDEDFKTFNEVAEAYGLKRSQLVMLYAKGTRLTIDAIDKEAIKKFVKKGGNMQNEAK